MPQFAYKARNEVGKSTEGIIEAETQTLAAKMLLSRGMTPVSIQAVVIKTDVMANVNQWHALNSLSLTDLILFSRQMHSLTKAGVPIIRAIRSLASSTRNLALAKALKDIAKSLESGLSLGQALAQHERIFDNGLKVLLFPDNSSQTIILKKYMGKK